MRDYAGYPAIEVYFDQNGAPNDATIADQLRAFVTTGDAQAATDLFVFSHGWNNTDDEAFTGIYSPFFTNLRDLVAAGSIRFPERTPAVVAVYWPSKAFVFGAPPGQGQGIADPVQTQLFAQLDRIGDIFPGDPAVAAALATARAAVPNLDTSPQAADDFVAALAAVLPHDAIVDEGLTQAMAVVASTAAPAGAGPKGRDILSAIGAAKAAQTPGATTPAGPIGGGGGASIGGGAGIFDLLGRVSSAAADFLNLFTYYTMKQRAGTVGATGLAPLLGMLRAARALRIHLLGHSFGGRLVTAAANGLPDGVAVNSVSLLQAAYSHYGLAQNWDGDGADGAFRAVVVQRKASDFLIATHSVHDSAVGTWYPLASQIARQVGAAAVAVSKWGGMGADGAQATPECVDDILGPTGSDYAPFPAGKRLRNLDGSGATEGAPTIHEHGDVAKPEIVSAVVAHIVRYCANSPG